MQQAACGRTDRPSGAVEVPASSTVGHGRVPCSPRGRPKRSSGRLSNRSRSAGASRSCFCKRPPGNGAGALGAARPFASPAGWVATAPWIREPMSTRQIARAVSTRPVSRFGMLERMPHGMRCSEEANRERVDGRLRVGLTSHWTLEQVADERPSCAPVIEVSLHENAYTPYMYSIVRFTASRSPRNPSRARVDHPVEVAPGIADKPLARERKKRFPQRQTRPKGGDAKLPV